MASAEIAHKRQRAAEVHPRGATSHHRLSPASHSSYLLLVFVDDGQATPVPPVPPLHVFIAVCGALVSAPPVEHALVGRCAAPTSVRFCVCLINLGHLWTDRGVVRRTEGDRPVGQTLTLLCLFCAVLFRTTANELGPDRNPTLVGSNFDPYLVRVADIGGGRWLVVLMGVWWHEADSGTDGGVLVGGRSVGWSSGTTYFITKQSTGMVSLHEASWRN